jgi:surface-anchored protein
VKILPLSTALMVCLWAAAPAAAQDRPPSEDPNLDQTVAAGQRVAQDRKVLARGHVDVGPRFLDGDWTLMIHDDQAKTGGGESVWRHADRTVLRVTDAARLPVPDDPAYSFLPSDPGADVYVVPQTQDLDVVWVGWNTQDPEVMETIDRGVTMTLTGVQGPGSLVVYLQSGDFAEPKVLWDSTDRPKPAWVDVNTHSHANWVFSKPGVYLVQVRIAADLIDGSTVSDTRELRFAVGSRTPVADAFGAAWEGPRTRPAGDRAAAGADHGSDESGGLAIGPLAVIALAALVLLGGLALAVARARRVKRRARSLPDVPAGGNSSPAPEEPT